MGKQIRRLGIALMLLYVALFLKLNELQVVRANDLANDPRNTRVVTRDFARARGVIQAADGAVLAESEDVGGEFKRLRHYPEGELFAHVTGYFSFTFGATGVERAFSGYLSGRSVPITIRGIGDLLSDRDRTANVTLSISKRVQQVARETLGNRKGAVAALDPTTGAVLALWSFPSFDPTPLAAHDQTAVHSAWDELTADEGKPLLARSFQQRYFPGSTFKVVTASAALERKPELAEKSYPVLRDLDLPRTDKNLPNFGGGRCGGRMPDLLRVSCNTGFAQMGLDIGADDLTAEANDYGFNERPPLDIPSPARSFFPDASSFERNEPALAQSAIGQQDVSASPLFMAMVAGAIGNGGIMMAPHVVAEVRDSEGEVLERSKPEEWRRPISPETAAALRDMMVDVVRRGTATRIALPGVQVAAKTGTAQTIGDNSHAWIIGFAPADAPKVAIAVIVESQPGLGDSVTGGRIAAPIARTVLQAILGGGA